MKREGGRSIRRLARDFKISPVRVRQILLSTGGDPLATQLRDLARVTEADLERERERLQDRIRSDRRRLRMVLDELDTRRTDRILGVCS